MHVKDTVIRGTAQTAPACLAILLSSATLFAADYKMTTPIPAEITTPAQVETRIGALEFNDGVPTPETAQKVWDQIDFGRGVEAFLNGIPGASMVAIRTALREVGAEKGTIGVFETLMDSKSLFLTGNTETVYFWSWMDLKDGPVVVESPPGILGVVDDFWFRYVTDLGNAGPDRGKGESIFLCHQAGREQSRKVILLFSRQHSETFCLAALS